MNISEIKIFQYHLSFRQPFVIKDQVLTSREGLIIQIKTNDGVTGSGEAAPLPGLSPELLKKTLHQIKELKGSLVGSAVPVDLQVLRTFSSSGIVESLVSSVRFAVEMAMLDILVQSKNVSLAEILGCVHPQDVATAGLLQGTLDEVKEQAERLVRLGYKVLKLKVGNKNIPLDVKKVETVQAVIGPHGLLRLDANRAWGLREAVAFGQNISHKGVEFVEEPLSSLGDLEAFVNETKLPVALDESLHGLEPEQGASLKGVEFLVIKPTVMGGIIRALDWIVQARRSKKHVIISSSFESGAGMAMLANLAALGTHAAGLGTFDWLSEDITPAPLAGPNGVISKKSLRFSVKDIKMDCLTEIKT